MTVLEQIKKVCENIWYIREIEEPCVEAIRIAVCKEPDFLKFYPDDQIAQIIAVCENPLSIEFVENPSEELQLLAINLDSYAMRYINSPTKKVFDTFFELNKTKSAINIWVFRKHIQLMDPAQVEEFEYELSDLL